MIALYIFLVIFIGQVISWIGKTQLSSWAHEIYLFISRSPVDRNRREMRKNVLKTKNLMLATSSQDEFAKWARLRRKMDKEILELDQLNKQIGSDRSQFNGLFSTSIWIFTSGLQFLIVSWYRSSPVFYLPPNWFPPMMVWLLSFPSAPYGAVSTTIWALVCKRALSVIIKMISDSLGVLNIGGSKSTPDSTNPAAPTSTKS